MDLILENIGEISIVSKYGSYANEIRLYGVDQENLINQLDPKDVLSVVDIKDVIDYHDHHELIQAIGDIDKFVEVFGKAAILDWLDVNLNEEEG